MNYALIHVLIRSRKQLQLDSFNIMGVAAVCVNTRFRCNLI